jgi:uncharacterized protein (TIGR03067 family)
MRIDRVIIVTVSIGLSAAAPVPPSDQEALQGVWHVAQWTARNVGQAPITLGDTVDLGTITFAGNEVTMRIIGLGDSHSFTFTLDTLASPRRIRLVGEGSIKGDQWSGIYRVGGDSLRLALPIEHWTDRPVPPTDFTASNTMAVSLTRAKR